MPQMPEMPRERPRLVVLGPVPLQGRAVRIDREPVLVGRDPRAQLVLDDPHVSRRHAALRRVGPDVVIEDLGSTSGTRINDVPVRGRAAVHDGDLISVAGVTLRFEDAAARLDGTRAMPAVPAAAAPPGGAVSYGIRDQHGQVVNNVGRDQVNRTFNQHVMHVQQVRESFLRDVAGAKSKARGLMWFGFALMVAGSGVYGAVVLRFISGVDHAVGASFRQPLGQAPSFTTPELLGPDVAGVPLAAIGLFVAVLGSVLLIVGIVLHITATARSRKVDQLHPLPAGPPYPF